MEETNKNQKPTQNPSKVVIVPKPPKGKTAETPEVSAEELSTGKVETPKVAKDTVKTGDVTEVKTEVQAPKK